MNLTDKDLKNGINQLEALLKCVDGTTGTTCTLDMFQVGLKGLHLDLTKYLVAYFSLVEEILGKLTQAEVTGGLQAASDKTVTMIEEVDSKDQKELCLSWCRLTTRVDRQVRGQTSSNNIVGRYRMLFPTVPDDNGLKQATPCGSLIWADITAVRCEQEDACKVRLLEDSFYRVEATEWESMISPIREWLNRLVTSNKDSVAFRVSLNPLSYRDVDHYPLDAKNNDSPGARRIAAYLLSQRHPLITGSSLGLALAIAGWAAVCGVSVSPLIVSGTIKDGGTIAYVKGVNEGKLAARDEYCRCINQQKSDSLLTILPSATSGEAATAIPSSQNIPRFAHSLSDLIDDQGRILTDGFDDYRKLFALTKQ